jgi:L-cysteine S-thiosulfotransferase
MIGLALALALNVTGDAIPTSLTGTPGDPLRGRALVAARNQSLCLLCHSGPLPEVRLQGDVGPDLAGTGARLSEGQIRLRIVDSRRVRPATLMPPYFAADGLARVAPALRGRTIFTAQQVEDVVAYLVSLK